MIDIYENILAGILAAGVIVGIVILFSLPYILITGIVYFTLKFLGAL